MKRNNLELQWGLTLILACFILMSCGGGRSKNNDIAAEMAGMNDMAKMKYLMETMSPDSVARFICDASLGRIEGVRIDTLSMAALYAYENYRDDDLQSFQIAFDSYADNLPLADKMRLRKLAASDNPDALGYQLGLEYVNDIRTGNKQVAEVEKEISAFKTLCEASPEDSLTFKRFMTGFKVALDQDGSEGIPRRIYEKYK